MLGPADLEDFYTTVDRERDTRQGVGAEGTSAGRRHSGAPLQGFSVLRHMMSAPGPFGGPTGRS
ncbi:hypothetical protein [Caenispirillum salinarum]|uniref:hypothetical protein n=1 Tax=Caenispirillum salinarum TaxID=859058 RepID=UPI003850F23E